MDLTEGTPKQKAERTKIMMLAFGIMSIVMMFAGFTSAYLVSSKREDWVADFELPNAFLASTVVIIISSIALFFAKRSIQKEKRRLGTLLLWTSFLLGSAFIFLQFRGFGQIISEGFYFTGPTSTINSSYIYLVVLTHLAHVFAGLIVLLVLIYKHSKQQYKPGQMLGLQLGAIFWHFVDILWIFLFLFFIF